MLQQLTSILILLVVVTMLIVLVCHVIVVPVVKFTCKTLTSFMGENMADLNDYRQIYTGIRTSNSPENNIDETIRMLRDIEQSNLLNIKT